MEIICILIVVTTLAGCAQMIPATAWEIEPGVLELSTTGNIFASNEGLLEKIAKKASKKFGGAGFDFIDNEGLKLHSSPAYTNEAKIETHYKTLTKVAKCKKG